MDDDIMNALNGAYGGANESNDFDDLFGDGEDDGTGDLDLSFDAPSLPLDMPETQIQSPMDVIPQEAQEDMSNAELSGLIAAARVGDEEFDINALNDRELEVGEKDATAVDYGDISDDDELPDEEEPSGGPVQAPTTGLLNGIQESAAMSDDGDDLFGDDDDVNMSFEQAPFKTPATSEQRKDDNESVASDEGPGSVNFQAGLENLDAGMTEEDQRQYRLQLALLQGGADLEEDDMAKEEMSRWLHMNFPLYNPDEEAPYWNRLLPPRDGAWSPPRNAKPPKKPRPIRPTKVTLDIEPDQKAIFTSPAILNAPIEHRADLVHIVSVEDWSREENLGDSGSDDELPNGLTNEDLEFICTDFDTLSHAAEDEDDQFIEPYPSDDDIDMLSFEERPAKKRRTGLSARDIVSIYKYDLPSFDDPQKLSERIAEEVVLNLNDPRLLVEEIDPESLKQRARSGDSAVQTKSLKERLARRFKTSNDASYNLLQQNQKKVRGQLTNMTIDHSIPAVRLQYPYYQVKLSQKELRNWHRKPIQFKSGIAFTKLSKLKRKDLRLKSVRDAFARSKDLSIADNSHVLLLEYSEEHPVMLSQTGMGNKIVNYYRKTDANDASRPKAEIGDTSVLMPEDKSPFNNFGHIDPGQTTLALYNTMYRAPIFKQTQSPQDFLILREHTGLSGQVHYLRNIDFQYVVGQELPTVQVPGTHSRMVTTVSKNRLKAIAFRIARRKKSHRIRVEEVTRHFPDTNDMQNRQKMKEFMAFNKEQKEWEMKNNELIPEEDEIQKTLTPEEICLLESMQVGAQYLHDSGYAEDDDKSDDEDKEGQKELSIEQQLAPWKTTKNFIQATQGKAMLRLYGEGDPSGRGEAFSFIKTSMKGGFKAQGGSTNENIAGQRGKGATGGHTYNVASQQRSYDESIRNIWDKQRNVLSSQVEAEDIDDEGVDGQIENATRAASIRATPASGMQTPSGRRRDDETGTSFSKRSAVSQVQQFLRIRRKVWNAEEETFEWKEVIESDQQVIKLYQKRKDQIEQSQSLRDLAPTGDPETDARHKQRLEEELARLESTTVKKRRRSKKQKLAEAAEAGSPNADGADSSTPGQTGGRQTQATQRKCANCGMVGHIKTNKKLCPMLNGSQQPDTGGALDGSSFMSAHPSIN